MQQLQYHESLELLMIVPALVTTILLVGFLVFYPLAGLFRSIIRDTVLEQSIERMFGFWEQDDDADDNNNNSDQEDTDDDADEEENEEPEQDAQDAVSLVQQEIVKSPARQLLEMRQRVGANVFKPYVPKYTNVEQQ